MKKQFIISLCLLVLSGSMMAQDSLTKKQIRTQQKSFLNPGRPWTFELPLWIPGFAGAFTYGDVSIEGEDGEDLENPIEPPPPGGSIGDVLSRLFTKNWYLKFFFLTRISYEKNRFICQLEGITGTVGGDVKFKLNDTQIVQANFQTVDIRLIAGYKIVEATGRNNRFRYELFGYVGGRTYFQRVTSDLNGIINKLDVSPIWFEPLIGVLNQFTWKRWFLVLQGDYGGLFVGSKQSVQITTYAYYRVGKLNSIKLGWSHLDIRHQGTFFKEDYDIDLTFSGPGLGLVFHF